MKEDNEVDALMCYAQARPVRAVLPLFPVILCTLAEHVLHILSPFEHFPYSLT